VIGGALESAPKGIRIPVATPREWCPLSLLVTRVSITARPPTLHHSFPSSFLLSISCQTAGFVVNWQLTNNQ